MYRQMTATMAMEKGNQNGELVEIVMLERSGSEVLVNVNVNVVGGRQIGGLGSSTGNARGKRHQSYIV